MSWIFFQNCIPKKCEFSDTRENIVQKTIFIFELWTEIF